MVSEVIERAEALRENLDIGRVVPEFGQKYFRERIHQPFHIVYKREPKKVRVARVWRRERLLELSGEPGA